MNIHERRTHDLNTTKSKIDMYLGQSLPASYLHRDAPICWNILSCMGGVLRYNRTGLSASTVHTYRGIDADMRESCNSNGCLAVEGLCSSQWRRVSEDN